MSTMTFDERIKAAMIELYWEQVSSDISDNNFESIIEIIEDIRDRICMLAPHRHDLHADIHEHIDINYIKSNQIISLIEFYNNN